jgi:lysophospholipase L1-like esterase
LSPAVRTVLCFGDSNTWGTDPAGGLRFPRDVRWPGRLQAALGDDWHVVEEGLPGRTTTLDSPLAPGKNGLAYLVPCLDSHAPLDAVVIFLGTNDLADRYSLSATDVARAAARLVEVVRQSSAGTDGAAPQPILACPPRVGETEWEDGWKGAPAKSALLSDRFGAMAQELACPLVDLAQVTRFSDLDGVHLDADGHAAVAQAVAGALRRLFA